MIRSKIRSIAFLIVLIIIIAIVSVGAFVVYYVNQNNSNTATITQNKLDLFKSTVNEMVSLAGNFYGGSWFALDNGTFYAIYNGRGGYDVVYINGTTATISQNLFYNKQAFFPYAQSNTPPTAGILIILSNSTKDGKALIMLFGYYWNSIPNPAQETYEQILNESTSSHPGTLMGMRGNNIWMYSEGITGESNLYIELNQNEVVAISTIYVNTSLDQLQTFVSKAEDLLKSLES
jgi:hypothetical protein